MPEPSIDVLVAQWLEVDQVSSISKFQKINHTVANLGTI